MIELTRTDEGNAGKLFVDHFSIVTVTPDGKGSRVLVTGLGNIACSESAAEVVKAINAQR